MPRATGAATALALTDALVGGCGAPQPQQDHSELRRSPGRLPEGYRYVAAHPARYDCRQLYNWRLQALDLLNNRGVVGLDVDEARNRVYLGVLDSSYVKPVRAALVARGVPAGAIIVEVASPFRTW